MVRKLAASFLLLIVIACGSNGDNAALTTAGVCRPPVRSAEPPAGISVTLSVPKKTFNGGESIRLDLSVENNGSPVAIERGAQQFEFWVESSEGVIWLWSQSLAEKTPPAAFQDYSVEEEFARGASKKGSVTWGQSRCGTNEPVPPGRYVLRGAWVTAATDDLRQGWWSDPVAVRIE